MKLKYLCIISLILIMVTIGAASASENMTDDESISSNDEILQEVDDTSQEVDDTLDAVEESPQEEPSDDYPYIVIRDEVYCDNPDNYIAYVTENDFVDGNISLKFDNQSVVEAHYSANNSTYLEGFCVGDLNFTPTFGKHNITFIYQKVGVAEPYINFKEVEFTYTFDVWIGEEDYYSTEYGFEEPILFFLPENSNGVISIKINGKSFKLNQSYEFTEFDLTLAKLNVGVHKLEATFNDFYNTYPQRTVTKTIIITPHTSYSSEMSVGEKEYIRIIAHKGAKLSAVLYESDEHDKLTKINSYTGKSSISIPLEKIATQGFHPYSLKIICDGKTYNMATPVFVGKNYAKIKASVTKKKDSAKIVVKSPKLDSKLMVILDDHHVHNLNLISGNAKKTLSSLAIGKHRIKLSVLEGVHFYSNTFFVTVKKADKVSLSLKKVKVKKSAKKLVLKATVKYNKKLVVKKKVTFKFNGKKYTAKTNKKGIAKITVKKKVLKKLKVGKKVKYQVSYCKATAKRIVKVKK